MQYEGRGIKGSGTTFIDKDLQPRGQSELSDVGAGDGSFLPDPDEHGTARASTTEHKDNKLYFYSFVLEILLMPIQNKWYLKQKQKS